jgi:tripartite-type tricarboxylate transporter receptor subunit TctC
VSRRRHLLALATSASALFIAHGPTLAQADKTTRNVVPFAAGGPIDVTVRILGEAVKGSLGTVIVENKPGAVGNIGIAALDKP